MINRLTILFLLALAFTGCGKKEITPEEYLIFYSENKKDFSKIKTSEVLQFEASFVPSDYLALKEVIDTHNSYTKTEFEKIKPNYDSAIYFTFKIKPKDETMPFKKIIKSKEYYSQIKQYIVQTIQNDFSIETGGKKFCCLAMQSEADLNIQNCISFVVSFEKPVDYVSSKNDLTLVYNDNAFQNGILKFNFKKETVNGLPKIKTI